MKLNTNLIFLFLILTSIFSCSDDGGENVDTSPSFSYNLDGDTITLTTFSAFVFNGNIGITGQDVDGNNTISIGLAADSEGTFAITTDPNNTSPIPALAYIPMGTSSLGAFVADPNQSGSGTLTISNVDTANETISGTFSFTGSNNLSSVSFEIENGIFNNIPYSTDLPNDFSGGTANFDLDGQSFDPTSVNVSRIEFVTEDNISIVLNKPNSSAYTIFFPTDSPTGTFNVGGFTSYRITTTLPGNNILFPSSGTITITENDLENREVRGTFEAVLEGGGVVQNITNGEFDIVYEE
ncbi:MAG: DUF6252 family protein [Bacteroidota bacterium]